LLWNKYIILNLNIFSLFGTKFYTKAIDACFSNDYTYIAKSIMRFTLVMLSSFDY